MEAKAIDVVVLGLLAVTVVLYIVSAIGDDANPTVSFEAHNFTTNNTPITLNNDDVNDYGCIVYHGSNTTYPMPTANYLCANDNVTIYTNGTNVCYPNITANCNYYTSYSYQRSATVWGLDFAFMIVIVLIGAGMFVALKLIKAI